MLLRAVFAETDEQDALMMDGLSFESFPVSNWSIGASSIRRIPQRSGELANSKKEVEKNLLAFLR